MHFFPFGDRIKHIEFRAAGAAAADRRQAGKRETGEKPVRSRHCKSGMHNPCQRQPLVRVRTGKAVMRVDRQVRKPAGCWYRTIVPDHE